MTTLTDARFDSLRASGYTGATNDMLLQWLQDAAQSVTPPLVQYHPNVALSGGAASGPVDGNNPPTDLTIGFATVTGVPESIGGGNFQWRFNAERQSGRCYLQIAAQNFITLGVGDVLRFEVTLSNPSPNGYSAAVSVSGLTGATIVDSDTALPAGTINKRCFAELEITDPGWTANIRTGAGTTANNVAEIVVSNPALYDKANVQQSQLPNTIADAWQKVLVDVLAVGPAENYHRNDYWRQWLKDGGYDINGEQLNDMEWLFWAAGGSLSTAKYFWKASVPSSATMPAWNARGYPFEINVRVNASEATAGTVLAADGNANHQLVAVLGALSFEYIDNLGVAQSVAVGNLATDQDYAVRIVCTADGVTSYLDGVLANKNVNPMGTTEAPGLDTIASLTAAGSSMWEGFVWNMTLTDSSVMQDGTYQVGANDIWADLDARVSLAGDFDISCDWARTDRTGTNNQLLFSATNSSPHLFTLSVDDTGAAQADRIQVGFNAAFVNFTGALSGVQQGQHIRLRLTREGDTFRCFVDGEEVATSPQVRANFPGTYVDRIGGNHNNGVRWVGALSNVSITTDTPVPPRGFLDYGTPHPDLLEENTFTSAADLGGWNIGGDSGLNDYNSDGLRVTPTIDGGAWIALDTGTYPDIITTGFTVSYEMEKSAFDGSVAGNDRALCRFASSDAIYSSDSTEAFDILSGGAAPLGAPVKTKVLGVSGTHAQVTISYDPAASANGTISLFVERFLVGQWAMPNAIAQPNFTLSGLGGIAGAFNFLERIRNVSLYEGPIDVTVNGKLVVGVGDSNMRLGQYQSGNDVNNDPPLVGYNGVDYPSNGPTTAIETFQNESLFAQYHREFSKLGIYPTTFQAFCRGGSSTVPGVIADGLEKRVDAALGVGTEYPTPGVGSGVVDVWIVQCVTNDVAWMETVYPDPNDWPLYADTMRPILQAQLDRMIDAGNGGQPDVVVLINTQRRYGAVPERDPVVGPENSADAAQFINAVAAEFDGYRGLVRYVDIYSDWTTDMSIDGLHANEQGHNFIAEKVREVMPNYIYSGPVTYTFPMDEGSGTRVNNTDPVTGSVGGTWTGENWTPIDANDRRYRMNEGTGATLADSGDPGGKDATIAPFDESNWLDP